MENGVKVRGEYTEYIEFPHSEFKTVKFSGVLKEDWIYLAGCNKRKKASGKYIRYSALKTSLSSTMFRLKKHPQYIFDHDGNPWYRVVTVVNCDVEDVPDYIWQKVFQKIENKYREELDGYEDFEFEEWLLDDLPWYERPMVEQMDSHVQLYRWNLQLLERMSQSSFIQKTRKET